MIYFLMLVILLGSWFLPWWWVALPSAFAGYKARNSWRASALGFFSVFLVWLALAYYFDLHARGMIGTRLAGLLQLPFPFLVLLLSACIGGLYGATAALTGYYWRQTRG